MSEQLVICESCGATNRVDSEKEEQAICGSCNQSLKIYDEPVHITDGSFQEDVLNSKMPVILDFWAPWCGPCLMIGPTIEELAKEMSGRVKFAKMNTDENPMTPGKFGIMGIPTLILFKDGQAVDRIVGAAPKKRIVELVEKN